MASVDEELKTAKETAAAIMLLAPSMHRASDATIDILRKASLTATRAIQGFSSQQPLNATRGEAATALSGLCGVTVTRDMIDRATRAVDAWADNLANNA